jgi:serine protease Do
VAIICTALGILIASNFDLSPRSVAEPASIAATPASYPVVERNGEMESPFVAVVERVKNAVVNISARAPMPQLRWWHQEQNYTTSSGSGFFFREDGYILTNNHVVKDAEEITVRTSSGYEFEARLVGSDSETDLAVIKVEPEGTIAVIPFGNSDEIKVGDWAIAIGNPFPQQGLDRTVTVGVISAQGRSNLNFGRGTPTYQNYIQTDASINPGNSGGPLLNIRGECIGVNAAISSPTGSSVGIGFAIPINMARAIVPDLIESGRANRGYLGIWLNDITEGEAKRLGLEAVRGVMIDSVFYNSPAERAGIKPGDVIVRFNGHPVENASSLRVLVASVKSGQEVPVEIVRDGEQMELATSVADRETFLASSPETEEPDDFAVFQWLGMELMEFTEDLAAIVNVKYADGMYVRRIYPNSPADNSSVVRGTVLLQVNDKPVKTMGEFEEAVSGIRNPKMRIPLIVQEPDGTIARKVIRNR